MKPAALVTGGSRGIGKAIAIQLAQEGADIVLAARTKDRLDAAAAEITAKTGRKVIAIVVNTGDDGSVQAMGEQALAAMGHVDILVNAAAEPGGYAPVPSLAEVKGAFVDEEINIKVKGYIRCAQAVVPSMKASGWGRIVNISGLATRQSGNTVGSIRNVAVAALTKNLADELGPSGITVNCVAPGRIATDRLEYLYPGGPTAEALADIPLRRWGEPREFGESAAIQRQIHNLVVRHDMADTAGLGVEQRRGRRHFHYRSGLTELEIYVQQQVLTDLHFDGRLHRRTEARGRGAHIVDARIESWDHIPSDLVGGHLRGHVRALVRDRDLSIGDNRLIRIVNCPYDPAGLDLSWKFGNKQ
jgi:NAD(P)-dependent dehydrogenase (short-subunit alcohol dehydrogenase family)